MNSCDCNEPGGWLILLAALLATYGYFANIYWLATSSSIETFELFRIGGILFAPLGVVLGFVSG